MSDILKSLSNIVQINLSNEERSLMRSCRKTSVNQPPIHIAYETILNLYQAYRDTLLAHNVYHGKVKALLPKVNELTRASQLTWNVKGNTNSLYTCLFPDSGIRNMVNEGKIQASFDSVVANFKGPARDYLLSRIMYRARQQGRSIPYSLRKQYRRYSMNKAYRKIIARTGRELKQLQRDTPALPNELLGADGKTKIR